MLYLLSCGGVVDPSDTKYIHDVLGCSGMLGSMVRINGLYKPTYKPRGPTWVSGWTLVTSL